MSTQCPAPDTSSRFGKLIFLILLCHAHFFSPPLRAQEAGETQKSSQEPTLIEIPDGTPVQLRFAQAIWGRTSPFISDPPPPFAKGDAVRMVAAADVEINGHIVIRRGSIGQATVTRVNLVINPKHPTTGISLRLDWLKSIDNQLVPIRVRKRGKQSSIMLDVYSDRGGFSVEQASLERLIFQQMTFQYLVKSLQQKLWVPVGTRMVGFVHGNISLDARKLAEAESRLPLRNTTGLMTIFRTKGHNDQKPVIYCDGKAFVPLGSRQFFELEMSPGAHTFSVNKSDSVQLNVSAGKQYYLLLHWHTLTGNWKLDEVSPPEGEDGISTGEMVVGN